MVKSMFAVRISMLSIFICLAGLGAGESPVTMVRAFLRKVRRLPWVPPRRREERLAKRGEGPSSMTATLTAKADAVTAYMRGDVVRVPPTTGYAFADAGNRAVIKRPKRKRSPRKRRERRRLQDFLSRNPQLALLIGKLDAVAEERRLRGHRADGAIGALCLLAASFLLLAFLGVRGGLREDALDFVAENARTSACLLLLLLLLLLHAALGAVRLALSYARAKATSGRLPAGRARATCLAMEAPAAPPPVSSRAGARGADGPGSSPAEDASGSSASIASIASSSGSRARAPLHPALREGRPGNLHTSPPSLDDDASPCSSPARARVSRSPSSCASPGGSLNYTLSPQGTGLLGRGAGEGAAHVTPPSRGSLLQTPPSDPFAVLESLSPVLLDSPTPWSPPRGAIVPETKAAEPVAYEEMDGNVIIMDVGTQTLRAGFAFDQEPRFAMPNVVACPRLPGVKLKIGSAADDGRRAFVRSVSSPPAFVATGSPSEDQLVPDVEDCAFGDDALQNRVLAKLHWPVERGMICDWDSMEKVWFHAFARLGCDPHCVNLPVLVTEPLMNPKASRERTVEVLLETFGVSSVFLCTAAEAAMAASGKTSGVVVSCGHGETAIVPIVGRCVVPAAIRTLRTAGEDLDQYLGALLVASKQELPSGSSRGLLLQMLKEKHCFVAKASSEAASPHAAAARCESVTERWTPTSTDIVLAAERHQCPELLFSGSAAGRGEATLPQAIMEAIEACPIEVRGGLYEAIIPVGGGALFPNFDERLKAEIARKAATTTRVSIVNLSNRKDVVWRGAAWFSMSKALREKWVTADDYDSDLNLSSLMRASCPSPTDQAEGSASLLPLRALRPGPRVAEVAYRAE